MSKNISNLSGRKGLQENLFDLYGQLAIDRGSPDKKDLAKLAEDFLIGNANTYGAVTFYDFLKPANRGKKVYLCNGSVCHCAGTQKILKQNLLEHFDDGEIGHMTCLGRCHENNAFHYNGKNYSGMAAMDLDRILKEDKGTNDVFKVGIIGKSVFTENYLSIEHLKKLLNNLFSHPPEKILDQIKESGLRGRGGAGFPIGSKLDFCKKEKSTTKFIICNADEGDPGAYSDRFLMEKHSYSVILGMLIAGYVVGSNWGVIYIRGEYPESIQIMKNHVQNLQENGLSGSNIMNSGFDFNFKIIGAKGSYICGEETALINSIEGQRPEVRVRPPYPAQSGLFQKPTVVNNVETLAALPYILKHGGKQYASIGKNKSTGTKLMCLDSHFINPGICEVEMGTPLSDVIYGFGGGFNKEVKALHIGGPLGGIVPISEIEALTVDFESFRDNGFLLGHASIIAIPSDLSFIAYLEHLFEFAAEESCGKCFPCRLGTKRAQEMFHNIQHGKEKLDLNLLDDLLHTLEIGSLCAHGGGIPLPVRNILQHFPEEIKRYTANL
jgi:NADH-quinone oxidoreductase subunit F